MKLPNNFKLVELWSYTFSKDADNSGFKTAKLTKIKEQYINIDNIFKLNLKVLKNYRYKPSFSNDSPEHIESNDFVLTAFEYVTNLDKHSTSYIVFKD